MRNIIERISEMTTTQRLAFEHDWKQEMEDRRVYADGESPFQHDDDPWKIVVADEA